MSWCIVVVRQGYSRLCSSYSLIRIVIMQPIFHEHVPLRICMWWPGKVHIPGQGAGVLLYIPTGEETPSALCYKSWAWVELHVTARRDTTWV